MASMTTQAVMGVIPPDIAEARIAMRWPSVAAFPAIAKLGSSVQGAANGLIRLAVRQHAVIAAILLIPLLPLATLMAFAAWGILAPLYFSKVLPIFGRRYLLTNRRLMIARGLQAKPSQEVKLEEIDDVRVIPGSEQPFYLSGDLEIISAGKPVMILRGVPEYQSFIVNIQDTYLAWGRKSPPKEQTHPASELK